MLKPADPNGDSGSGERPLGDLVRDLVDEAKAYARAELEVVRAIAAAKGQALVVPSILFGVAFILALTAVTALAVGVVIALAKFVGPLAAGLIGLVIFSAIGGGCGWYGYQRLRRDL